MPVIQCKFMQKDAGFTLVELLLVILLMGVIAASTLAVVTDEDDQEKYDATKTYLQLIKKAIVGDADRKLNGATEVSGFAADMGRLPACLRELVQGVLCDADTTDGISTAETLPAWQQDADSMIWGGWRGPYLQALPESNGLAFRDAWLNRGPVDATANADINYGWLFGTGATTGASCDNATATQPVATELVIQSCGSDGLVDGSVVAAYTSDYPLVTNIGGTLTYPVLINAFDYLVELGNAWETLNLSIVDQRTGTTPPAALPTISANTLRIKINFTEDGGNVGYPTVPDDAEFLSQAFPAYDWNMANGTLANVSGILAVPVGSTQSATGNPISVLTEGQVIFPDGGAVNLVGCSALSPCVITVPSGATLSGTTLTISSAGNITVPPQNNGGFAVPMHTNIADLALPIGQASLTVVCNADGVLFDGNCDGDNDDAISKPYLFDVKPRRNITPPSVFSWAVQ